MVFAGQEQLSAKEQAVCNEVATHFTVKILQQVCFRLNLNFPLNDTMKRIENISELKARTSGKPGETRKKNSYKF